MLGVSERTVYRLVEHGHLLRPRVVGGAKRWFPGDVKVYLYRLRRGDFEPQQNGEIPAQECVKPQKTDKRAARPESP